MTTPGRSSDQFCTWLPDPVSIGILATAFPSDLVDSVIDQAGVRERRYRTLPARFMVYYVLALVMFAPKGYLEVMALLSHGLNWLRDEAPPERTATVPAIAKARSRLGVEPLVLLFDRVCGPLADQVPGVSTSSPGATTSAPGNVAISATGRAPGGSGGSSPRASSGTVWRGLRMVSVEEVSFELPDTAENTAAFGGLTAAACAGGAGRGGQARARLVVLGESRSGALLAAALGPAAHPGTPLAPRLMPHLDETTLLLADKRFPVEAIWHDATSRGTQLVWLAAAPATLPVSRVLADGTCLTELPETWSRDGRGAEVRMIECESCTVSGRPTGTTFTLLTTLADPVQAPAEELVAAYTNRWRGRMITDSLTAGHEGPANSLRSRSPDMVRQEIWATLCVYQSVRRLIWQASNTLRMHADPPRLSRRIRIHRRADIALPRQRAELLAHDAAQPA
ncbi:MAG TPA: transposase domain-containing protein [Trebonia sp.]|jgi:hypothetical protein